ncbi:hypothetical protein TNCV_980411 [Trichonephila clavipes]|uniref:Uncharacterized protein n=1 Tax=Trichonephila clavipes TaxID=2585209 RepID=A0A8X6S6T3_TRICX|nr:hypothetical protein TNCV_980411 [Trichonephila clavipes]
MRHASNGILWLAKKGLETSRMMGYPTYCSPEATRSYSLECHFISRTQFIDVLKTLISQKYVERIIFPVVLPLDLRIFGTYISSV